MTRCVCAHEAKSARRCWRLWDRNEAMSVLIDLRPRWGRMKDLMPSWGHVGSEGSVAKVRPCWHWRLWGRDEAMSVVKALKPRWGHVNHLRPRWGHVGTEGSKAEMRPHGTDGFEARVRPCRYWRICGQGEAMSVLNAVSPCSSSVNCDDWCVTLRRTWLPGEVVKRSTQTVTVVSSTITALFYTASKTNEPWPIVQPNDSRLTTRNNRTNSVTSRLPSELIPFVFVFVKIFIHHHR